MPEAHPVNVEDSHGLHGWSNYSRDLKLNCTRAQTPLIPGGKGGTHKTHEPAPVATGDHETAGTTVMVGKGAEPLNERTDKRTNEITDNEFME